MKKIVSKPGIVVIVCLLLQQLNYGQDSTKMKNWFLAYETLEMSMNGFKNFAGTVGYRIDSENQVRIVGMDVIRSEKHLSSSWQSMGVHGGHVKGRFRTIEINYDRFFGKRKNWYYGLHAGYKNDQFNYLLGPQKINNHTVLAGPQFGFQKMNLFHLKHLYINFSMPFHYYFNHIPAQQWGDTKIKEFKFINNIWFFVGYTF